MFIVHIALQGCVRPNPVPYGITPDTGGHIRYVLELIAENERAGVARQDLVVRRFDDAELGSAYATREDKLSDASRIVRIDGASTKYLAKEDIWREHVALCTAFEAYIEALPQKPDIIHAHYADAGVLAAHAKKKFGIPMVFTGHSLGRVKAQTLRAADVTPSLETRIATEDAVIATADRIIASSRDEAEVQYGLYPAARAERIRVNPPGCDLSRFSATSGTTFPAPLLRQINRFLDYPDLPPVLAIARPVRRKNLSGLVRAFGEDDGLQARANLVIFAGNRHDIRDLSEENQHVIEELLYLVDRYDLYGKVALPKMHADDDVPWLYRYAAHLGGVFANTAFNEPFGLTFLEAAASGVPVVATRSGGPTDIVGQLENGTLVDPVSPQATADALHRVLEDPELWQQQADNGLNRLDRFSWQRHAATYLSDMRRLKKPRPRPAQLAISLPGLLVSDIDNTLTGDRPALRTFAELLQRQGRMTYAIATGRSLHDAINVLQDWNAPVPKVLITSVGSEIYFGSGIDYDDLANDEVWAAHIDDEWHPASIAEALFHIPGLAPQPRVEMRRFKLSYFGAAQLARTARQTLAHRGLRASVIASHGRFIDVLPHRASKGQALRHLASRLDVPVKHVLAAGDSGNDIDMLALAGRGIAVGNASGELDTLRARQGVYFARAPHAAGIVEGVAHHLAVT